MDGGQKQVVDEEGSVDQQLKNAILKTRDRVAERHDQLYTVAPYQGAELSTAEQNKYWGSSVRQYLVRIEPLLKSDEIPHAKEYYNEKPIAQRAVRPEDGPAKVVKTGRARRADETVDVNWGELQAEQRSSQQERRLRTIDFPNAKTYRVVGLKGVIENPREQFTWTVDINRDINPQRQLVVRPQRVVQLTKDELYRAVRHADEFLQHHAGIAVETGHKEVDEEETNPI